MDDLEDTFVEGETYDHEDGEKSIFVMAVDTIDETEAWLAIMWIDSQGNTLDADELVIKSEDYNKWKMREVQ